MTREDQHAAVIVHGTDDAHRHAIAVRGCKRHRHLGFYRIIKLFYFVHFIVLFILVFDSRTKMIFGYTRIPCSRIVAISFA